MILPPQQDEILSSWLIRNSLLHGSDPMGWIYGFWGEWRAWTRDIDRFLPDIQAYRLAKFSRLDIGTVKKMTLAPLIAQIEPKEPKTLSAWRWIIPTGRRNRSFAHGQQFCPECLLHKEIIFRKNSRLSWHTQCSMHNLQLLQKCACCNLPFSPHLVRYDLPFLHICPRCGGDLSKIQTAGSPKELLLLQRELDILSGSPKTVQNFKLLGRALPKKEFFLLLRDLLTICTTLSKKSSRFAEWQRFLFGNVYFEDAALKEKITFETRSVNERAALLVLVHHILQREKKELAESLEHVNMLNRHYFTSSFPLSSFFDDIPTLKKETQAKSQRRGTRIMPAEPRSAKEVESLMNTIRKYL